MSYVDIFLVIGVLGFGAAGARRGFASGLGRFFGAVVGFFAAGILLRHGGAFAALLWPHQPVLAKALVFLVVFILLQRLVSFLFGWLIVPLKMFARLPLISTLNAILGAVLGGLEGVMTIGSLVYVALTFAVYPPLVLWLSGSLAARWLHYGFTVMLGYLL